jgi:hypothetical protein
MLSNKQTTPTITTTPPSTLAQTVQRAIDLKTLTTPQILRRSMFGLWGLSLLWVPLSITAIQTQRQTIKTIAKDSVPSVLLAQRIVDAMSDMDASVANALLDPNNKELLIQDAEAAGLSDSQKAFNKRRADLAERLTKAASNITFDGEEPVIRKLIFGFGDYLSYVERAQSAHAKGDRPEALKQYQLATNILDNSLIPQAYELREINSRALEKQYNVAQYTGGSSIAYVSLLGIATIAGLVALQFFLNLRTRRTLNPTLLGATAIAILFLLTSLYSLWSSGDKLRVLKEDSYNSLLALRAGRSLMYAANSDESRYLLDTANQETHEKAFFAKTNNAFGQSTSQTFLNQSIKSIELGEKKLSVTGYFGKAITNITFPKERSTLVKMMRQFQSYMAIDQQIRAAAERKDMKTALTLCLGESNQVFDALKDQMDEAIKINQEVFDSTERKAMEQLDNFELKASIALALIATLTFFGLKPRLKEYS